MKNKKKMLARFLYTTGTLHLCRKMLSDRLVIFNYHRIRPDDALFESGFDDNVYGPSQSVFRSHLEWLKGNTNILSEPDLMAWFDSGRMAPGINVMITFDDGYIDNYTLAFPVLKELRIPALFFIPTGLIENRRLGWWDIAAFLVKNTGRDRIHHYANSFDLLKERSRAIRYFHSILGSMRPEKAADFLTELAEYCNVPFPGTAEQSSELMDWDQIRTLSENGINIGSHTHSHATLSTLNRGEITEEMIRSRSTLRDRAGVIARSIAYPLGGYRHFSSDAGRIAEEAGYEAGFSFDTGFNTIRKMNRYDLRRICGPDTLDLLYLSALFPNWFASREKKGASPKGGALQG